MDKKLLFQIIIGASVVLIAVFFLRVSDVDMNTDEIPDSLESTVVFNNGGLMEGHTPRGFQGMGTGLFIGDNLNQNFPEGETVQAFITFDIEEFKNLDDVGSVSLLSDDVHINGTPIEDLGNIVVESVSYDKFSSAVWNLPSRDEACVVNTLEDNSFACDVSEVVKSALENDESLVQFRLRFERDGDRDGRPDMVLFYKTNSNSNTPGIFRLEAQSSDELLGQEEKTIHIPVVAHLIKDSGEVSTQRSIDDVLALFKKTQEIWDQGNIVLDLEIEEISLENDLIKELVLGNFEVLYNIIPKTDTNLHVFYIHDLLGPNGLAFAVQISLIADVTTVDDFRATGHEIGHLLGLKHTLDSKSRLMFSGANGRALNEVEVAQSRERAELF